MSDTTAKRVSRRQAPSEPIDVVDGLPDRSSRPSLWKYLALLLVFLAWVAALIYIDIVGSPGP